MDLSQTAKRQGHLQELKMRPRLPNANKRSTKGGRVLFLPPSSNECATYERFLCDKDRFSNTFSHFDRLYRPIRSDIEMTGIAAGMPDYLLHLQYAPAKCNCTQRE